MKLSFVEALDFTEVVYKYFGSDVEFAAFQEAILANPECGYDDATTHFIIEPAWN